MKLTHTLVALWCGLAIVCAGTAGVRDTPIEEIMEKAMKKGGLRHQISIEIDKDSPNWDAIQKKSKELSQCCGELCKQTPPKGDKESWKKLTETLATNVKKFEEQAEKKDQVSAKTTIAKINNSCKACHDMHRE